MNDHQGFVAITGANGTIGYACVVYALQKGYHVRCIVRRADAIEKIKSGPSAKDFLDRVTFAVIGDNTKPGAYDEALTDIDAVVHIAGAWPLPHLDPDNDIYWPFISSTKGLIESAKKAGTVKRIVFTQAGAGLVDSEVGDTYGACMENVLDEHVSINEASKYYTPPLQTPHRAYCAAKAQCMTYLHNLSRDPVTPLDIVQIIPGTVIGPSEFATTASKALAHMDRQTKALLFDDMKPRYAFGFVHVRDCARVHIEALDAGKINFNHGHKTPPWFVAAASVEEGVTGEALWNAAADMLEKNFSQEVTSGVFKIGRSKVPTNMPFRVDSRMTERTLLVGEKMKGLLESVEETARWYLDLRRQDDSV